LKAKPRSAHVGEVVVLTTAMLTFISFWRAAAIVLCDMASTAWYVGGIAETAIGAAAPWFIAAVMLFSACVLAIYVEGSSLFVRGGVYKIVKEAMGGKLAKISVSALMFDYVLTGAISSVSAGQYLAGLLNTVFPHLRIGWKLDPHAFAVVFAVAVVLYFWRQNIRGIEESSDKALKIMWAVGGVGIVLLFWCLYTALTKGFFWPHFELRFSEESLGWLKHTDWPQRFGALGLAIALGHAFLGMSGVESLAQVYREMEAPKLQNLRKAALMIFLVAFTLTTSVAFFAVGLIPEALRPQYADNLLSGLAMSVAGPHLAQVMLQICVVVVGVLILCGAVNTSIMGSNGVLNRLAEDGIMPDWFRWLHPRYGTTYRMIHMVVVLQIVTIILCRGEVYLLGEAYAFGVIWSLVFNAASIMILRFKVRGPREWMVPLNVRIGSTHFPVGLSLIFLALSVVAVVNLMTKQVATVSGVAFTAAFYMLFVTAERLNKAKRVGSPGEHREKLNLRNEQEVSGVLRDIDRPNRTLVAVRDPNGLVPLQRGLESLEAETTELVVLYCKIQKGLGFGGDMVSMSSEEDLLFTRVISLAEKHGKSVVPLIVISNDPFYAITHTAQEIGASEVVVGVSGRVSMEAQLERLAMTLGAQQMASGKTIRFRIVGEGKEMNVEF
jgi:amino acid transporter